LNRTAKKDLVSENFGTMREDGGNSSTGGADEPVTLEGECPRGYDLQVKQYFPEVRTSEQFGHFSSWSAIGQF